MTAPTLHTPKADHVDTFIWDYEPDFMAQACNDAYNYARWCLMLMRLPASEKIAWSKHIAPHVLYCVFKDKLWRVTMASRLGHIGLTQNLNQENSYEITALVNQCDWWTSNPDDFKTYKPGSFMV